MVDQHSARLDISSRERNRLMGVGIPGLPEPFTPDSLPPEQYERWGETTLETRAREVIRRPTRAEITQEGSEFRSDLLPHNYRTHTLFIPDVLAAQDGQIFDVQTDFQPWACVIIPASTYALGGIIGAPQNQLTLMPWQIQLAVDGYAMWFNFPTGQKFSYRCCFTGGATTVGAGWNVWLYDRWITEPFNRVTMF